MYHKSFLQTLWDEQKDTVLGSRGQRQEENSPVVFSLFLLPFLTRDSSQSTLEGCHDFIVVAGVWKTASSFVGLLKQRLPFIHF